MKKIKLGELPNHDNVRRIVIDYENHEVVRIRVKISIESETPLHPYVLEKLKELSITLLAHSLEDIDRVLNTEICIEEEELEREVSSH